MSNWTFYALGVPNARFTISGETVKWQKLKEQESGYTEKSEMTAKDGEDFALVYRINPLDFLTKLDEYNSAFRSEGEEITTASGKQYTKKSEFIYAQRHETSPKDILYKDGEVRGFICPYSQFILCFVQEGYDKYANTGEWLEYLGENQQFCNVRRLETAMVECRDGVCLATDVILPICGEDKLPTVLVRTPYNKRNVTDAYINYARHGYAVVIQDVRGRSESEGEFIPMYSETEDGDDCLNWIAAQPWSDGNVGMIGGSYLGYVQWAAAASGNPHLAAMVSQVCAGSPFVDIPKKGGCYISGTLAWNFAMSTREADFTLMNRDDWDEVLAIRPLKELPKKALGYDIDFFTKQLEHHNLDDFWNAGDWFSRSQGLELPPAMIVSGWFDDNGMGTTQALELAEQIPKGKRKAILGPWRHGYNANYDLPEVYVGTQGVRYDLDLRYLQWFDRFLKGKENGIDKTAPVEYYTIGENKWKTDELWPVLKAENQSFYLTADGGLSRKIPTENGKDTYKYNPDNPAPQIIDLSTNELQVAADYTAVEKRSDVLCYTTPVLKEDLTITGDAKITLYISSDAVDTDFVVRITEVTPDGRSIKYIDGVMGAKYRDGFESAKILTPGEVVKITIGTSKISKTFFAGNRLRLQVTSSAEGLIFPNSNTENGFDSEINVIAENTIYHGEKYPSCVTLPVEI